MTRVFLFIGTRGIGKTSELDVLNVKWIVDVLPFTHGPVAKICETQL